MHDFLQKWSYLVSQQHYERVNKNSKQWEAFLEALKEWEEHKVQWAAEKVTEKVKGKFTLEKPKLGKLLSLTKPKGGWVQPQILRSYPPAL